MTALALKLSEALKTLPLPGPRQYLVGFSGGADSTALLLAARELGIPMRAVHVNHHLHADARVWAQHCRDVCQQVGVPLTVREVTVCQDSGLGLEAAARNARYGAFEAELQSKEVLLTAHHAQDQLETLLLRLLRGAGVSGLAGIRPWRELGRGFVARPLLSVDRSELETYLAHAGIGWIEDPSNEETSFDRNYLRHLVLPALQERWPAAGRSAVRTAALMGEAQTLLADLANIDIRGYGAPLPVSLLQELSHGRVRNALRAVIAQVGLPTPSAAQLEEVLSILGPLGDSPAPVVTWPGAEARVYRGKLYLLKPLQELQVAQGHLCPGEVWEGGAGRLSLIRAPSGWPDEFVADGFDIRFRQGGEQLQVFSGGHHRPLKKWFQETGVLPWMRDRVPLVFKDSRLVAIGDLWQLSPVGDEGVGGWRICWDQHPPALP